MYNTLFLPLKQTHSPSGQIFRWLSTLCTELEYLPSDLFIEQLPASVDAG